MNGKATIYDIMSPQFSEPGMDISYLPVLAVCAAVGFLTLAIIPARKGALLSMARALSAIIILLLVVAQGFLMSAPKLNILITVITTTVLLRMVSSGMTSGTRLGRALSCFFIVAVVLTTLTPSMSLPAMSRKASQIRSEEFVSSFDRQSRIIAESGEVSFTEPLWVEPDSRQALRDDYEDATLGLWRVVWSVIGDGEPPTVDRRPWQVATVGVRGGQGGYVLSCHYRDGVLTTVAPVFSVGPDLRPRMPVLNGACPLVAEPDPKSLIPATDISGAIPKFADLVSFSPS